MSIGTTHNGHALAMGWHSMNIMPERAANKRTKIQNKNKSAAKNFQPGLLMNSEQKVDEMHVSSANAKPNLLTGSPAVVGVPANNFCIDVIE